MREHEYVIDPGTFSTIFWNRRTGDKIDIFADSNMVNRLSMIGIRWSCG